MATNKMFTVVGVSTLKGVTKIRFANDIMRIKILQKNGHYDMDIIELPHSMHKAQAIEHLRSIDWYADNRAIQDAMDMVLYRNPQTAEHKYIVEGDMA